ncbi:MAG: ABC transporter substrate-binding protein [Janthinobacterium lividum]
MKVLLRPARLLARLMIGASVLVSAVPAQAESITISATRSVATAAAFIAQDKGYFAAEGLQVDFKYFDAAQPVAVAVASGDAQFGVTALSAGFYNMAGKKALKLIASAGREEPGFSSVPYFVSAKSFASGVHAPKDLAGKTVGLTQVGSPAHFSLAKLAEKYKFPLASIRLVPLQSFPNIVAATKGGAIDGGILASFSAFPAQDRGDGKIIGWVGDETPWQLSAVFTSNNTATSKHALVARFLRAYDKGAADFAAAFQQGEGKGRRQDGPGQADLLQIISKYSQLSDKQVLQGLDYIRPDGALDPADIRDQVATWQRLGLVDKAVNADAIVDLSYAPAGTRR